MYIAIQQNISSPPSQYEIETPGGICSARKKFFSWNDKLQITAPHRAIVARITGKFSCFRSRYSFELSDGSVYRFWGEKIWKGVLVCEGCKERIRLYQHKGLNYSLLQNKTQVAAFSKNAVTIGSGDQYEIRVNDDANLIVVICIVLAIDLSENEGNNTSITYHFGNIGPEDRLFDKTWEPG
jgi:uncharacterized protein YxjI